MRSKLERQLRELNTELEDVYAMSEEAACFRYNVDNKAEAIAILQAEIDSIVDDDEDDENDDYYRGWCDPAFRTEGEFDRLRL